ncbi:MAG: sodium:proton antiporter [Planctomycetota bacterium]|nr:sodium:proton antiporter [Planctomycetota bacterium]
MDGVLSGVLAEAVAQEGISLGWSLPFGLLLGCIALMPFANRRWWEKWYPGVAVGLGGIVAGYYFLFAQSPWRWVEEMESYVSFIVLLGSLFVISGGIVIHVNRMATPAANCVLLVMGAVVANVFGTTGASMLLIRPYLRMNGGHLKPFHMVFFIFIVSNVGGALTPIGDPPLFLGYLNGVPFWWVLSRCGWAWAAAVGMLVAVFFVLDRIDHGKAARHDPGDPGAAVMIHGIHNLLLIGVVVWAVFQPGMFEVMRAMGGGLGLVKGVGELLVSREVLMAVAAVGSVLLTGRRIYERNEFGYGPIREVAILFFGIFSAMVPALQWLDVNAGKLPLKTPGQYYFASGALSSVLDNAPTYLTLLQARLGRLDKGKVDLAVAEVKKMGERGTLEVDGVLDAEVRKAVGVVVEYHAKAVREKAVTRGQVEVAFLLGDGVLSAFVVAVSLGSVFFGACTYIGNGPNFMVKSIAEAGGAAMPSFVGYVMKYTLPVLVPVYVVIWAVFLAGWW